MACEQYQAQFTDFLEATLPEAQWRELEWHLRQCPACAADIKRFRQTVGALHGLEVVAPPRHLARTISSRIASLAPVPAPVKLTPVRPARRPFSWRVAGSLAGACLAVAVVATVGVRGLRPPGEMATVSAPATGAASQSFTIPTPEAPVTPEAAVPTTPTPSLPAPPTAATVTPKQAGLSRPSPATPPRNAAQQGAHAPAAPAGGVGPAAPTFKAMDTATPSRAPGAIAFGEAPAPTRPRAVGVDIKVDPPGAREVGAWGTVEISVTPEGNVPHSTVRILAGDGLEVRGSDQIYTGPLTAGEARHMSAQIQAQRSGTLSLRVIVRSDTPVVDTDLPVHIPGYHYPSHAGQTHRQFHSVPLAEAAQQVAADGGATAWVTPELVAKRITADFSQGMSVPAALRLLAQMADGRLEKSGDQYKLVVH